MLFVRSPVDEAPGFGIPAQRGVLVPRVDRNQRCAEERGKLEGMRDGEFAELAPVDADDDGPGVGNRVITRTAEYGHGTVRARSEAHPSELQSLMRNSYAGFSLKK